MKQAVVLLKTDGTQSIPSQQEVTGQLVGLKEVVLLVPFLQNFLRLVQRVLLL
jgi:hypothetical protein